MECAHVRRGQPIKVADRTACSGWMDASRGNPLKCCLECKEWYRNVARKVKAERKAKR